MTLLHTNLILWTSAALRSLALLLQERSQGMPARAVRADRLLGGMRKLVKGQ